MNILLIEDNDADREAIKMAFKEVSPQVNLAIAEESEKAAQYFSSNESPNLVLLDLNLPGKSGLEILSEIKNNPRLQHIPVLILTTSQNQTEICRAYKLHASCFLTKPFGFEKLVELVREIYGFWFKKVKFCYA